MTKRIFHSIFLAAAGALLAALILVTGFLYSYFGSLERQQMKDELSLCALAVEQSGERYLRQISSERYRLSWIDADGNVLYDTRRDAESLENHAGREEIRQALETGEGESQRYSSTLLEKTIYTAMRLSDGTVLRISISRASVAVLVMGLLQPLLVILAAVLIVAALLAKRLSKKIVGPLNELDLDHPMDNADAYDELAPLLGRLNRQRQEIDRQMRLLQKKTDEFQQITGSMLEGLVLLDSEGRILTINPAARRFYGAQQSCAGQDFLTLERSHDVSCALQEALRSGHSEIRVTRGEQVFQLDITRSGPAGAPSGAVLLMFDVTEREHAELSRREFTANVSHELKTPLQGIIGSAELIENGMVKPEDLPRFVGHIRTEAQRLVTLIGDIIRLSQLDEGVELPKEPVALRALCSEVLQDLQDEADKKSVSLHLEGEEQTVSGVRRLLYETFYNLVDNAIKYNREGGSVTASLSRTDAEVCVCVADTGIGIAPEHQSRIFERFYRVDKSHSKASGGTGLGLSIVKHAVKYHAGRLEVESVLGEGSRIRVFFPLQAQP